MNYREAYRELPKPGDRLPISTHPGQTLKALMNLHYHTADGPDMSRLDDALTERYADIGLDGAVSAFEELIGAHPSRSMLETFHFNELPIWNMITAVTRRNSAEAFALLFSGYKDWSGSNVLQNALGTMYLSGDQHPDGSVYFRSMGLSGLVTATNGQQQASLVNLDLTTGNTESILLSLSTLKNNRPELILPTTRNNIDTHRGIITSAMAYTVDHNLLIRFGRDVDDNMLKCTDAPTRSIKRRYYVFNGETEHTILYGTDARTIDEATWSISFPHILEDSIHQST